LIAAGGGMPIAKTHFQSSYLRILLLVLVDWLVVGLFLSFVWWLGGWSFAGWFLVFCLNKLARVRWGCSCGFSLSCICRMFFSGWCAWIFYVGWLWGGVVGLAASSRKLYLKLFQLCCRNAHWVKGSLAW